MTARLGSEYRYFGKLVLVPFRYFSIDTYRNIDIFDNTSTQYNIPLHNKAGQASVNTRVSLTTYIRRNQAESAVIGEILNRVIKADLVSTAAEPEPMRNSSKHCSLPPPNLTSDASAIYIFNYLLLYTFILLLYRINMMHCT